MIRTLKLHALALLALATPVVAQDPAALASPDVQVQPLPVLPPAILPSRPLEPMIRDITKLHNVMPHMLVGVGIVTGLSGTGSSDRGTRQALLNMIRDQSINLTIADVVGGNVALVSLTASLPPFSKQGHTLDVKVQVIGDATSLRNGQLLRAELRGVDGLAHAVAQGPVGVGGFVAQGSAANTKQNGSSVGWVNNGGLVIRDMPSSFFSEAGDLELQVSQPTIFNAMSIAEGVRKALAGDKVKVSAVDPTLVRISLPLQERTKERAMDIIRRINTVRVPVENPAKVIIDQASGTVLAGEGVLISPCVVGLTDLTISVIDEQEVSQPTPFSNGDTTTVNRTRIEIDKSSSDFKPVAGGATVSELLQNLRSLGLTPLQLVSVFQALDDGGFLHAQLEMR